MSDMTTKDIRDLLEVVQAACQASIDAIAHADMSGTVLWLRPPFVQCAIHETVSDRLESIEGAVEAALRVLRADNVIQPG